MERVNITIQLSADVVQQAQQAGLLTTEQLEKMLIEALATRQRINQVFDKLHHLLPTLEDRPTPDQIAAELEAYRQEQRLKDNQ